MDDTLLTLKAAAPFEQASHPSYSWNNAIRTPPGIIFQYTWTGSGMLQRGRLHRPCPPGHALLMLQGEPTRYFLPIHAPEPWTFAWINFSGAESLAQRLVHAYGNVLVLSPEGETVALLKLLTRHYAEKTFLDRYQIAELLGRFLAALGRELATGSTSARPRAHQIRDHLQDHHRRPLNIKEVAAHFGFSREHLTREFQQTFGEPPAAFLRRLRLATARGLLRGTRLPLGQIAKQSGFGGQAHFCRAFRAATGMTPARFRAAKSLRPVGRRLAQKTASPLSTARPPRPNPPHSTRLSNNPGAGSDSSNSRHAPKHRSPRAA